MSLKLITLRTTQTLLAEVEKENDFISLKNPVQVIAQPNPQGNGVLMGFAPFLEYAEEFKTGIEIHVDNVLCITSPIRELENQYNQVFGAGIQIASVLPNK
jgi:hypothetical protein